MKEKMISGELRNLEEDLKEWNADFENRYKLQSSKFLDAVQDLHSKEITYRRIEDELQDLISQFSYLTAKNKQLDEKEPSEEKNIGQAAQSSSDTNEIKKSKSYSQVVIVESQCKIKHYELNTKAYEIRDAYNELTEVLEHADAAKRDLSERLKQIVHRKSHAILTILSSFIVEAKEYDVQILEDIEKLCKPIQTNQTRLSPSKMLQMKKQQSEDLIWGQDSDMSHENIKNEENEENQCRKGPESVEMEEVEMMPFQVSEENSTPKSSKMGENDDGLPMTEEIDIDMLNNSPPAKIPDENTNSDEDRSPNLTNNNPRRTTSYSMMPS